MLRRTAREVVIFILVGAALYILMLLVDWRNQLDTAQAISCVFDGAVYGGPLGLALWAFYRVVRFAVKG
jgi:hypothetical protein